MLFMLEKQALLGIVRSKSFSICQAAINKDRISLQHLKNCLQLSALPPAPWLRELCLPTHTHKSSGTKEEVPVQASGVSLTVFTDL